MAFYKEKYQRDFRLHVDSNSPTSIDFSQIKVGKNTLKGEISALIDYHKNRNRKYDKDAIERAIHQRDIKEMRRISNYYFETSGIYSRLCRYMAYLYRYDWIVTPQRYDEKVKDEKVIEGWIKASTYLENSDLKRNFGLYALSVIKNGCYYGYILDKGTAGYLQELHPDYCRCRYIVDGVQLVEFNIKFFDDFFADNTYKLRVLKAFPKEFQKAYIAYKEGKLPKDYAGDENGWFSLDPTKTVKFSLCDSDAPLFIPVIPAILDLEDAKQLDKDRMVQRLLKIIIQQMPIDKNGDLIFDVQEAQALHNNAVAMLGNAIGMSVLTTFADVDVADLSDRSTLTSVDDLERVERSLFNEAGVSQKQFNTDGQTALDKSIANDEATMTDLLLQFKKYSERLLAAFNKNPKRVRYTVTMLPTTIYNYKDLSKMYKEQAQIGFSKLLPQVALGMTQQEIIATANFENEMLALNDLFVPPQMSSTMSGTKAPDSGRNKTTEKKDDDAQSGSQGGRPPKPDDEKSEKTIRNIEASG